MIRNKNMTLDSAVRQYCGRFNAAAQSFNYVALDGARDIIIQKVEGYVSTTFATAKMQINIGTPASADADMSYEVATTAPVALVTITDQPIRHAAGQPLILSNLTGNTGVIDVSIQYVYDDTSLARAKKP